MKRSLRIALTLALALAVSTASAFATVVSASFNKINIEVDGGLKAVSGEYFVRTTGDVPYSILYMGTTYLPLAKVCEFVGKDISWNGETYTASVTNREAVGVYPDTEVPDFGKLSNLSRSEESSSDDLMIYNYYDYTMTSRSGREAEDLQRYVGYLFDAGFTFSLDDSRQLIGSDTTTLYAYKNAASGRVVVIGDRDHRIGVRLLSRQLVVALGEGRAVASHEEQRLHSRDAVAYRLDAADELGAEDQSVGIGKIEAVFDLV